MSHWCQDDVHLVVYDHIHTLYVYATQVATSVTPFNMDGRAFIRAVSGNTMSVDSTVSPHTPANPTTPLQQQHHGTTPPCDQRGPHSAATPAASQEPQSMVYQHAVMNLPASAIEFVDAFHGAFDAALWDGRPMPMVHCYAFQRAGETQQGMCDGCVVQEDWKHLYGRCCVRCVHQQHVHPLVALYRSVEQAAGVFGWYIRCRASCASCTQRGAQQGHGVHIVCSTSSGGIWYRCI